MPEACYQNIKGFIVPMIQIKGAEKVKKFGNKMKTYAQASGVKHNEKELNQQAEKN